MISLMMMITWQKHCLKNFSILVFKIMNFLFPVKKLLYHLFNTVGKTVSHSNPSYFMFPTIRFLESVELRKWSRN